MQMKSEPLHAFCDLWDSEHAPFAGPRIPKR